MSYLIKPIGYALIIWLSMMLPFPEVALGAEAGQELSEKEKDLFQAVIHQRLAVVQDLISQGVNVNVVDVKGVDSFMRGATPLMYAAMKTTDTTSAKLKIAQLLIEHGANVNLADRNKATALTWAASTGNLEAATLLIEKGADVNASDGVALAMATKNEKIDVARLLIKKGADINAGPGSNSGSPLFFAAQDGNAEFVKELFDGGATLNYRGYSRITSLIAAAMQGHTDVVKLLVEHGAEANEGDMNGMTPIMWMALANPNQGLNYRGIIEILLNYRAEIDARDKKGMTALMHAAKHGHKQFVEFLVFKGADKGATDNDGKTALDYAEDNNRDDLTNILKH
ncbi:MAG: ankyrin repeat domain-containing protein [Alphaproteobacteria bacterium]|nr:ankyrin repeat domain-containing protein [Alphaproteobacteria bacterium]